MWARLPCVCVDHANTLQVRQQAAVHQAQTAAAEEEETDSKAYAAMEEMLGKAAAKVDVLMFLSSGFIYLSTTKETPGIFLSTTAGSCMLQPYSAA